MYPWQSLREDDGPTEFTLGELFADGSLDCSRWLVLLHYPHRAITITHHPPSSPTIALGSHLWGDTWSWWENEGAELYGAPVEDWRFVGAPQGSLIFSDYRTGGWWCWWWWGACGVSFLSFLFLYFVCVLCVFVNSKSCDRCVCCVCESNPFYF